MLILKLLLFTIIIELAIVLAIMFISYLERMIYKTNNVLKLYWKLVIRSYSIINIKGVCNELLYVMKVIYKEIFNETYK